MSAPDDRWFETMGARGALTWHRYRHVESTSGGPAEWELTPQASDWIGEAAGFRL